MDNYLGKIIGERYEIQAIIGIGGMSVVYKAYDRVDDRIVAVKILKDEFLANEEFRMRFKNESKAIAVLSHPNIVKVYDVSFGENLQYIVMEYVEGITLKEYIERQHVLDWREAVHFVIQILRALQHAHDKGIIHRDVKPQNIMLLPNANIKVTDFGIARFNRIESRNVNESSAIGSVHYVSPEQARGEYTDGRSDIYSVGVVLYEMLTGKVPFEGDSDSYVALLQLKKDAERPTLINSAIPLGLEQITLRAMQKNPADRYQSAAEFLSDLYEFKRNPQMKFDYTYFLDKDPTRHISSSVADIPVKISDEDEDEDEYVESFDDDDDDGPRNLTVPILAGVAVALVLVVAVIVLIAFGDTIKSSFNGNNSSTSQSGESFWQKLDIFGWFSDDNMIEVPNFLNEDFEAVFEKYPDLAIDPTPTYIYNTSYDPGKVIEQFPVAGEKVSKDTVIKLSVATTNAMIQIPDVKGTDVEEAEELLRAKGFVVELYLAFDSSVEENTVLYTDPNGENFAAYGSTVYVYYATAQAENVKTSRVPNVVGDQESVARAKIIAAGLYVGSVITNASSESLKGYVIGQNPASGTAVSSGVYVNLVVGNGVQNSSVATCQIPLPTASNGQTATVKTYLNGAAYDSIPNVALDGSNLTLSFTGSGSDNEFTVYIDSVKIYSGNIDFTKENDKFSNVYSYPFSVREYIPDVTGMTEKKAIETLEAKGFTNISVEKQESNTVKSGTVISQVPVSSKLTQYSISTKITIYVSSGSGEESTSEGQTDNKPVESTTGNENTTHPTEPDPTESTTDNSSQPPSEESSGSEPSSSDIGSGETNDQSESQSNEEDLD
ncbi:MAG: Stk1 family PASTA domain-containing Ser/Thr kinase [Oscillospiraceae bacterium]|nr:Stk1 family PASTA domain-containing Ser/Thr kinase [Oscillospiraceae bacterium]